MNDELKSQVLDELNSLFEIYSPREAGDVTANDIMDDRKVSRTAARNIMRRMVKINPEKYMEVKIKADNTDGAVWQWVLRRKPVSS